jgi:hypothetical protein
MTLEEMIVKYLNEKRDFVEVSEVIDDLKEVWKNYERN